MNNVTKSEALWQNFKSATENQQLEKALNLFDEILPVLALEVDYEKYLFCYTYIADLLFLERKFDRLLQIGARLYEDGQHLQPLKDYAKYYNVIGTIAYVIGDYESAKNAVKSSLNIYQKLEDEEGIIGCMDNIGELEIALGNTEEAIILLLDAKNIVIEYNLSNKLEGIYNKSVLAKAYVASGQYIMAKRYYDEILSWREIDQYTNILFESYLGYGELSYGNNQYQQAIDYYEAAIELAEGHMLEGDMDKIYQDLSELYFMRGEDDKAYYALKLLLDKKQVLKKSYLHNLNRHSQLIDQTLHLENELKEIRNKNSGYWNSKMDIYGCYREGYIVELISETSKREVYLGEFKFLELNEYDIKNKIALYESLTIRIVEILGSILEDSEYIMRLNNNRFLIMLDSESEMNAKMKLWTMMEMVESITYDVNLYVHVFKKDSESFSQFLNKLKRGYT